jgi:alanine racemase
MTSVIRPLDEQAGRACLPWRMYAGAALRIDAAAIAENTRRIAALTDATLMAVVKADGFGHGTAALAALDAGAEWLGVTSITEALPFRWRGVSAPILSWLNPPGSDYDAALLHDIDLAVSSIAQLQQVSAAAVRTRKRARVHLHLDTGLARDGIDRTEWTTLVELARLGRHDGRFEIVGVMSHLARADEPGDPETRKQVMLFRNALRVARQRGVSPRVAHLAATAGAITDPGSHFGMVRIGAGLYGIDPSHTIDLRGAMTLTAPVTAVRDVNAGTGVGYGLRYRTERRTRLALLPLGYADGVPRNISDVGRGATDRATVLLRGRRVPIVGTISMDQLVLDVGDAGVGPGEVATLFGPGDEGEATLRDWAGWAATIEHDIVTRIGPRVARETVGLTAESDRPALRAVDAA